MPSLKLCYETFRTDQQLYWSHATKFAMWQHPAVGHGTRSTMTTTTTTIIIADLKITVFEHRKWSLFSKGYIPTGVFRYDTVSDLPPVVLWSFPISALLLSSLQLASSLSSPDSDASVTSPISDASVTSLWRRRVSVASTHDDFVTRRLLSRDSADLVVAWQRNTYLLSSLLLWSAIAARRQHG